VSAVYFVVVIVLIVGMLALSARARRRQAASQTQLAERIAVGTEVMTTSGLHGTVVAVNGDDTVQLAIAPGVEVRWELAALRDRAALPSRYQRDPDAGVTPADDLPGIADPLGGDGSVDLRKPPSDGRDRAEGRDDAA
jgi:preprotein translocase subunit YajC